MAENPGSRYADLARPLGADYYGVADLTPARAFIRAQGGDRVAWYPRAIAVGMVLQDSIVELLADGDDAGRILYRHAGYDVVNIAIDQIALRVANALQKDGYSAFPVPASKLTSDAMLVGIFSQKLAASLAGLGWIGKSCLLVTPDHGPRVRWVAVLTDAPLDPTGSPVAPRCGECTACVDACPVGAFSGRMFAEDEPRETRFDAAACDRYYKEMENSGKPNVCGMCLWVCPHGRKKNSRRIVPSQ